MQGVKTILDLACRSPRGPLRRFIPYRHAAWALEENQCTLSCEEYVQMFKSLTFRFSHRVHVFFLT